MDAYSQGHRDCLDNYDVTDNPYTFGTLNNEAWALGWEDASDEFFSFTDYQLLETLSGRFI